MKVAINGYGTIGKRVADAVTLQDDMTIVGVTKTRPTYEAWRAVDNGFKFFAADREFIPRFEDAGLSVEGTLDELLDEADVVVDCTPGKHGANYLEKYKAAGVSSMYQGGEKADLCDVSFNAYINYKETMGQTNVRVVSCNTTGLCRTLYPLYRDVGIVNTIATMIRRSADPWDSKKGPINAIEPVLKVPSHHGPDVQSVVPDLPIQTIAVKVPTTIMHLHTVTVELKEEISAERVKEMWSEYRRIRFVEGGKGIKSTAQIMELAKDLQRSRSDMFEIAVWSDGVFTVGKQLFYCQAIHQEADVVPENIDCIRAMFELESDPQVSIDKTDKSLGIGI